MRNRVPFFPSIFGATAGGAFVGYQRHGLVALMFVAITMAGLFLWENRVLLTRSSVAAAKREGTSVVADNARARSKLAIVFLTVAALMGLVASLAYVAAAWMSGGRE